MSIEIKMNDYVENDVERLATVNGERRRNEAKRYAEASIQVNYEQTDGAQLIVALEALDKVYAQVRAHLEDLLETGQQREDRIALQKAIQEREAAEVREAKDAVGKMAEEFLATEGPVRLSNGTEVEVFQKTEGASVVVGTRFTITDYVTDSDAADGKPFYWGSNVGGVSNVWAYASDVRPVG